MSVNDPLHYDGSLFNPEGAKDLQEEMSEAALSESSRSRLTQADVDYTMAWIANWYAAGNQPAAYDDQVYRELMGWEPMDILALRESMKRQVAEMKARDEERG